MFLRKLYKGFFLLPVTFLLLHDNCTAQICTAKILQNDTYVCAGSTLKLTVSINDSADNCGTYSLSGSLQNGLLGWYPFCGNTNDISPNGNNGFATGPLSYTADRYNNPNTAIQFTGNGESVRTNIIDRTTTNSFSYVVWVNTPNVVTLPAETVNPSSGFSTDLATSCVIHAVHGYNWNLNDQHTGAGLYISNNGVFVVEHAASIVATPLSWAGSLNGWHSIAVVYDNHLPKLYVDGNFIKNGLITPYIVHPSLACDSFYNAGTYPYLTTGFGKGFNPSAVSVPFNNFKGAIDDIKIYNRALTQSEVTELYAKDKSFVLWSTGDTTKTITVTPSSDTSYSVTVANSLGSCRDIVNVFVKNCSAFSCDSVGIINNDTTVCKGNQLQLNAKNALSYQWYPRKGLSDSTIQNPIAIIDSSITYYLKSTAISNNLITNGDFENGNNGFTTTYTYCNTGNCLFPLANNRYSVGTDANFFHTFFTGHDHTTGKGNFMVVNGADPTKTVWRQIINVTPNTMYAFGCWISTMITISPAQIRFSINGVQLGPIYNAPSAINNWNQFYITWNSGSNTTAIIEIVDVLNQSNGNDFGLDDIYFGQINSCTDSIHVKALQKTTVNTTASICLGQSYVLPSGRSVNSAGIYKDTLKYKSGCDSVIFTVNLSAISPQIKNIDVSICLGQTYVLPSGRVINVAGVYKDTLKYKAGCDSVIFTVSLSILSPQFKNIAASICSGQIYVLLSGRIVNSAGIYNDTLKYKAGCDSVIVNLDLIINLPTSSRITQIICIGQSYTLPSGKIVNTPGIYLDTIPNSNGCDSIITTELKNYTPLSVKLEGPSLVCEGNVVTITANASGGDSASCNFLWTPANSNSNLLKFSPSASIMVHLILRDGCTLNKAEDSLQVTVLDRPKSAFTLSPPDGCLPLTVVFTNTTIPLRNNLYLWNFGDSDSSSEISPSHIFIKDGSYNISLIAKNSKGCSDTFCIDNAVASASKPVALFSASPDPNLMTNSMIKFSDYSKGTSLWKWDFGDGVGTSTERNPIYDYGKKGTFNVMLIVSGSDNCTDTAFKQIVVEGGDGVYIPNAFTPNGDGINDNFGVMGIGIHSVEMKIFNRWGEVVFYQKGNKPAWNGEDQRNGKKCILGVYVYIINVVDKNNQPKMFKGIVSLIR